MNRVFLLAVVAIVVAALRRDARACDPVTPWTHMLDTTMQATDHTPPTLPATPAPQIHFEEDSATDGCAGKCGDGNWVGIPAVATDDQTEAGRIGYRLSLASGTIPQDMSLPVTDIEPLFGLVRVYFNRDTVTSWDFTVQVIAIDLAGNESAPQMVRLEHSDSGCAVTGARRVRFGLGWLAFLALIVTAYRRRRP